MSEKIASTSSEVGVQQAITQRGPIRKTAHSTSVLKNFKDVKKLVDACSLDGRSSVAKGLERLRAELTGDLGGDLSCQQSAIVEIVARQFLVLELLDGFLFSRGLVIDKRRRRLTPGFHDSMKLSRSIAEHLSALGLERKPKKSIPGVLK